MAIDAKLWGPSEVVGEPHATVPNQVLVLSPWPHSHEPEYRPKRRCVRPRPATSTTWEVRDAQGRVVQAEGPETCLQIVVTRPIGQGQTIRGDNTLPLNGKLLKDGQRYTVALRLLGFAAAASFIAHRVV